MRKLTTLLLGATAILAVSPEALADKPVPPTNITINQVNLDNVWSQIEVKTDWAEDRVDAVAASVGNSLTGLADGPVSADVNQQSTGAVETSSYVWTGEVGHEVTSTSSAIANTSVISGKGDTHANIVQTANGPVQAINGLDAVETWATTNNTTAAANVSEVTAKNGTISSFQDQEANSDVFAYANSVTGNVDGFVTNVSTAAGNSATNRNMHSDNAYNGAVQTTAPGTNITAIADVDADITEDVTNATSAAGNQITAENLDANVNIGSDGNETFQFNGAKIEADAFTQVANFSGIASTSANGVGNAVSSNSFGGNTHLGNIQNNAGHVTSTVTLNTNGFSGGTGLASSSAIGNSISASATDGGLGARTEQFNSGNVAARTNVMATHVGSAAATATAIGNAATFSTRANAGGH